MAQRVEHHPLDAVFAALLTNGLDGAGITKDGRRRVLGVSVALSLGREWLAYRIAAEALLRPQLTEIDADYEGDAYFPNWDRSKWRETARDTQRSETGLNYAFVTYERN